MYSVEYLMCLEHDESLSCQPMQKTLDRSQNIIKYLWRMKDMFLVYGVTEEKSVKVYTDASF